MKKRNSLLIVLSIFTAMVLVSCNQSTKGNWSEADKKKFYSDMEGVQQLSNFGENRDKWVDCYYSKCEAAYSSYREADADLQGCEKIAQECSKEVLSNGSVKGKWSEADKEQFLSDMAGIESLSNFGENKEQMDSMLPGQTGSQLLFLQRS